MRPTPATAALQLELRHGHGRPALHDVHGAEFLLGSVPGCDLRLPGTGLPPIVALIAQQADGVRLRKLAPSLPMTLNGQPVHHAALSDGDVIGIGPVELRVHLASERYAAPPAPVVVPEPPPAPPAPVQHAAHPPRGPRGVQFRPVAPPPVVEPEPPAFDRHYDARAESLAERERDLEAKARELEVDRVLWYQRRAEMDAELDDQHAAIHAARREQAEAEEATRAAEAERKAHQAELDGVRDELKNLRAELYARYQERRDRLAGLQQAVEVAARKVQERKRALEEEVEAAIPAREKLAAGVAALERATAALDAEKRRWAREQQEQRDDLAAQAQTLAEAQAAFALEQQAGRQALDEARREAERVAQIREAELLERERQADAERQALDAASARYQAELVRLDRVTESLDGRERQIVDREADFARRTEAMARDSRELEEQARQLDLWQTKQQAEAERLAALKTELDQAVFQQAERAATTEGQQAMLTSLRTKLERMRDDVRQQASALAEQRVRQEAMDDDLRHQREELDALRARLESDQHAIDAERGLFEQRSETMQAAVTRLRDLQDKLVAQEEESRRKATDQEHQGAELAEQAAALKARAVQLLELQQKLETDTATVGEREATIAQAEAARQTLQEQLRKRGDELANRQKLLDERASLLDEQATATVSRLAEAERQRAEAEAALHARAAELDRREAASSDKLVSLGSAEARLERLQLRVREAGLSLAAERKTYFEAKARGETEHRQAQATLAAARADLELFHRDTQHAATELQRLLPDLELRCGGAIERLEAAREQLRGHLTEVHDYTRQAHDDIQALRSQVQAEAERVRQAEVQLGRGRAEHRLAVTAFRQQLIDWQTRVAEMRRTLAHDETRLERRHAEVSEVARQTEVAVQVLAVREQAVQAESRAVVERRGAVEHHLAELREWYRTKLRELADSSTTVQPFRPDVAPPTLEELDPGDRMLAERLQSLELIDADSLQQLLVEGQRQRRSLRQVLLASGYVTLYQIMLIESGDVDGLALGRLRVLDRVAATAGEAVYRVFDPTTADAGPRVLRHLSEAEAADAVRPDEFRQQFAAAASVQHPNLAATLEVLDIAGRPAVLQEWLTGLPSPDWPSLTAAPGVWYRLLCQAAVGLQAAHEAGLAHGHLSPRQLLLTPGGTVKIAGLGEPLWLAGANGEPTPADDLAALGVIAQSWLDIPAKRKSQKPPKPLPEALADVLRRLSPEAEDRIVTAAELLDALDIAGADLPASADAWERLVKYAGENATEGAAWRKSA